MTHTHTSASIMTRTATIGEKKLLFACEKNELETNFSRVDVYFCSNVQRRFVRNLSLMSGRTHCESTCSYRNYPFTTYKLFVYVYNFCIS